MSGSYASVGIHFVFSTKNRVPMIDIQIKDRLCSYMGGVIKKTGGIPVIINGANNHIHIYTFIPKTVSVSKFMEIVKGNTSKWIHKAFPNKKDFSWQDGYGAFSISKSSEQKLLKYIQNQGKHHKKISYQEEFIDFLKKYDIKYDEKYIWK